MGFRLLPTEIHPHPGRSTPSLARLGGYLGAEPTLRMITFGVHHKRLIPLRNPLKFVGLYGKLTGCIMVRQAFLHDGARGACVVSAKVGIPLLFYGKVKNGVPAFAETTDFCVRGLSSGSASQTRNPSR